jgi:hypothetical protein
VEREGEIEGDEERAKMWRGRGRLKGMRRGPRCGEGEDVEWEEEMGDGGDVKREEMWRADGEREEMERGRKHDEEDVKREER